MSLRRKFTIVVFLSLCIPIVVIGWTVYYNMDQVLEKDITQINDYLLDRLYIQVENELNDLEQTFEQVFSGDTLALFLMGSTTIFKQRMDEIFAENPLIRRVYVRPEGSGLALAKNLEYPEFTEEGLESPLWDEVWVKRLEEDLKVWDGPYIAPDGNISLIYPGPAYSIRKSYSGIVTFEIEVQGLLDHVASDVNTAHKHLHFVTAEGLDYLSGQDYSEAGFFSSMATDERVHDLVSIGGKQYLAFMEPFKLLNGYLLVLEDQQVAYKSRQDVSKLIIGISLTAFILALIGMSVFVQYMLVKPLKTLQTAADKVAHGDLTVNTQLNRKDELGQVMNSFNLMTYSLKDVIELAINSGEEVYNATKELFNSFKGLATSSIENNHIINELARIAENQSINLTDSSNLANDIAVSIQDLTTQMDEVKHNSKQVLHSADLGQNGISKALDTIAQVNVNVQQMIVDMDDLKGKSDEINEITDLINQVTQQTNLLALNASIEAARAGDAGLGFAVVAQEIRSLAEESREATDRIANLVNQVQTRVDQVSDNMQKQASSFQDGVSQTQIAGDTFGHIVNAILAVDQMIGEMDSHLYKVRDASDSIARNISDVASQAEESAASSEEIAASSEDSLKVVDRMRDLVVNLENLSEQLGVLREKFQL